MLYLLLRYHKQFLDNFSVFDTNFQALRNYCATTWVLQALAIHTAYRLAR
jgi:hypothetical protein